MGKLIIFLFIGWCMLVSCSSAPATINPIPQSTPTLRSPTIPTGMSCTLLHFPVTPDTTLDSLIDGHGHISGSVNAPVTIITFSDYQCFKCAYLAASLKQIRVIHPNDVRIIYIHAPQIDRDKDNPAIQAVEAADLQGKFWEMHDLLFEKQEEWSGLTSKDFKIWAESQAIGLGMDLERYRSDYEGVIVAGRLQETIQFIAGVQPFDPPLLFVNSDSPYTALADFASLDTVVRLEALVARQFSSCPPWTIRTIQQYIVTLHTIKGDVNLQLFPEKAPQAVNNFVFLARSGWYDGITFYRVLPGNRVMTGDPSETGMGNPGYLFETEITGDLRFDQPGRLAYDNDGAGTNGSRFFISLLPSPQWNGQYTIFGQVLSGLEILSTLAARDPKAGIFLPPGDELISVIIEER